jgi:flagellar biosynthesis protein
METKKNIKEVAALKYSPEDGAPQIVALGKGEIAQKILEVAQKNNVPVFENAELAHTLNTLSIGVEIPEELYEIVAQILVFVSDLDKLRKLK